MIMERAKLVPLCRWQFVQWHAYRVRGSSLRLYSTSPQRQAPREDDHGSPRGGVGPISDHAAQRIDGCSASLGSALHGDAGDEARAYTRHVLLV
jgi:hypothetical protein